MRAVQVAGPLADPEQVRGGVVRESGAAVDAGQRPLELQQQPLVAGVELDPVELLRIGAARLHERQRPVDLAGELLVALPGRALRDEVLVPRVYLVQVGVATIGERPAEVQGARRGVVGAQQPGGVGAARLGRELEAVHGLAPVGGQLDPVARLGRARSGLRELPRHPADLDHRHARRVGEHDRHLQQGLEPVAHGVGGRPREGLRAVAPLEHECLPRATAAEPLLELVTLAGEDQRRLLHELGRDRPRCAASGHSGCWAAGSARQASRSPGLIDGALTAQG